MLKNRFNTPETAAGQHRGLLAFGGRQGCVDGWVGDGGPGSIG